MGWSRLVIVSDPPPDMEQAAILAAGSREFLSRAQIVPTLEQALEGINYVVATTARPRQWRYPVFTARELGADLLPRTEHGQVAILFGQEDYGLDRQALLYCHAICRIPTVDLASLNLAQAILVVAYELMMYERRDVPPSARAVVPMSALEPLLTQWMELARSINYFRGRNPEQLEVTLRQVLGRAELDPRDLNIFRGFIRKVTWRLVRKKGVVWTPPAFKEYEEIEE